MAADHCKLCVLAPHTELLFILLKQDTAKRKNNVVQCIHCIQEDK